MKEKNDNQIVKKIIAKLKSQRDIFYQKPSSLDVPSGPIGVQMEYEVDIVAYKNSYNKNEAWEGAISKRAQVRRKGAAWKSAPPTTVRRLLVI